MIGRMVVAAAGSLLGAFALDRWLGGLSVDEDGRPIQVPIRTRIEIDAPIAMVWARLSDIEAQPDWMTDLKRVRLTTNGPVGVGTRGEGQVRILGIPVNDPVEVTEFSAPHRFAIRHEGRFSGHGLLTLDTLDGGRRTRVEWAETLIPPILPNLGALVQGPILQRVFQADLERLKALVEADREASGTTTDHADTHPVAPVGAGSNGHGTRSAG
jgi:uncharacterized protein YndB with AHSA1/START domain